MARPSFPLRFSPSDSSPCGTYSTPESPFPRAEPVSASLSPFQSPVSTDGMAHACVVTVAVARKAIDANYVIGSSTVPAAKHTPHQKNICDGPLIPGAPVRLYACMHAMEIPLHDASLPERNLHIPVLDLQAERRNAGKEGLLPYWHGHS